MEKGLPHARGLMVRLVPLAGKQHDVNGSGFANSRCDRRGASDLDRVAAVARFPDPVKDVAGDRPGLLAARVVAGHDDAIGQSRRDPPHLGPLASIAIAAAAEYAHQFSTTADRL